MDNEASLLSSLLVVLAPLCFILLGLWFILRKVMGNVTYSDYLNKHNQTVESQNKDIKEQTKQLKRIADALENNNGK